MKESQSSLTNINPLTIFLLCYPIDTLLPSSPAEQKLETYSCLLYAIA